MSKKSGSAMRRWIWLWGPLALIVVTVALCEWLAWPFLRGPLERALERGLSREVSLGKDFGVRFFGSIRAHGDSLVIGPPSEGPYLKDAAGRPRDFLRASDFALALPYSTVLAVWRPQPDSVLRVRSLEVDELEMTLVRTADGRANWEFGTQPKKQDKEEAELPEFDRLVVQRARIGIDDAVSQVAVQAVLRTREGSAGAAAPGASAPSAASAAASDPSTDAVAGASARGLEATAVGSYRKSKLEARLRTSGLLPLAAKGADAQPVPLVLTLQLGQTEVHVDGTARDVLALTALDARFRLAGPSLSAVGDSLDMTLPTTAAFETNGRVRKEGEVWRIAVGRLAVGSSRLQGDLVFDRSRSVPSLTGTLGGARLALPDLAPAFGAKPDPGQQAATAKAKDKDKVTAKAQKKAKAKDKAKAKADAAQAQSGRVLPTREFDVPSLSLMEADLKLQFEEVDLGTPELQPFAPLNGRLRLKDSRLSVDGLLARNSGGELRGALSLDAKNQKAPIWNADLQWSGIRLERFVKAGQGRNTKADRPAKTGYVAGALSGRAKLEGRGRSTAQMLGSLDGTTQWWVRDGSMSHLVLEITGIDIAEGLGLVISGDESLPVQCAVARTALKDGLMSIEVGVIDTPDTTILVSGTVALGKEQLDLRLAASPKDFSPLALRAPVTVEGSFAEPDVGLEVGALGMRALAGAALAAVVTPLAGLLALVDLGEEEKAVCQKAVERMRDTRPASKRKTKPR